MNHNGLIDAQQVEADLRMAADTMTVGAIPDIPHLSNLRWLQHIPSDRYVLRRIVGARALIDKKTGSHAFSWRRLGTLLGCDHIAVKKWHAEGIDIIVDALKSKAAQ